MSHTEWTKKPDNFIRVYNRCSCDDVERHRHLIVLQRTRFHRSYVRLTFEILQYLNTLCIRAVNLYWAKMAKLIKAGNFWLTSSDFSLVDFLLWGALKQNVSSKVKTRHFDQQHHAAKSDKSRHKKDHQTYG